MKLEKCDESSVQDLESEKVELQQEKDELTKRLAEFEEKYNVMETNCKLNLYSCKKPKTLDTPKNSYK